MCLIHIASVLIRRMKMPRIYVRHTHCKQGHEKTVDNTQSNGCCRLCSNARARKYRSERPKQHRIYNQRKHDTTRRKRSGWTREMTEWARTVQKNRCAICHSVFITTPNADHIHTKPPIPRALLCSSCNFGIGLFKDDPELMELAAGYVRLYARR